MDNPKNEIQKKEDNNPIQESNSTKNDNDNTEQESENHETSFLGFGILALPNIA